MDEEAISEAWRRIAETFWPSDVECSQQISVASPGTVHLVTVMLRPSGSCWFHIKR